jgi:hypothetical protein
MTSTPIGLGKRRRLLDLREPSPPVSMSEETLSASESEGEDSDDEIFSCLGHLALRKCLGK